MILIAFIGACVLIYLLFKTWRILFRTSRSTRLRGPPDGSFPFGSIKVLRSVDDPAVLLNRWATQYGLIFETKSFLNSKQIVLCDPKAIAHFYARDTWLYVNTPSMKVFLENFFGRGLLWAEGERHRKQRKAMAPAFGNAAIRRLTQVFFDSSYKVRSIWDALIESSPNGEVIIEVESWMNYIALDSVGIAGFSHDFKSIEGQRSAVLEAFEALGQKPQTVASGLLVMTALMFPIVFRLPTPRNRLFTKLNSTLNAIAIELLHRCRREKTATPHGDSGSVSNSLIELLIKAESGNSLTPAEVQAQMNLLLLAGYETTSIALTWALIELSRHQAIQTRLREELSRFSSADPTWDEMTNGLPYLDAVVHETLRLHPPLGATTRVASGDDVIPLSKPIETLSGEVTDSIFIAKGTTVIVPVHAINRSATFWGEDAHQFIPERWLDEAAFARPWDMPGYRNLLTFVDGPRTCLGKSFALAEFKAVLSVLIRNYVFEFPDGPDTRIIRQLSVLMRPTVAGQDGIRVPLRVRRVV